MVYLWNCVLLCRVPLHKATQIQMECGKVQVFESPHTLKNFLSNNSMNTILFSTRNLIASVFTLPSLIDYLTVSQTEYHLFIIPINPSIHCHSTLLTDESPSLLLTVVVHSIKVLVKGITKKSLLFLNVFKTQNFSVTTQSSVTLT